MRKRPTQPADFRPARRLEPAPNRVYALAITSLALFLGGLLVWRAPVRGFVATAEISVESSGDSLSSSAGGLIDLDSIRPQLTIRSRQTAADSEPAAGRLRVEMSHRQEDEKSAVSISFLGASRRDAIDSANASARQAIALIAHSQAPTADETDTLQARWQAVEARHYEERTRQDLDNFVENVLLEAARLERRETSAVATESGRSLQAASYAAPTSADQTAKARLASYRRLRSGYDDSLEKRKQAEDRTEVDLDAAGSAARGATYVLAPAVTARRIGGRPSAARVICLALLAGAGGVLMFVAADAANAINSAADVEGKLNLPVVGEAPATAEPRVCKYRNWSRHSRRVVAIGEAAIAVMLLWFVLTSLRGSTVADELAADPLGAFSQSFHPAARGGG